MENFEAMLSGSVQQHGHLCPGQVIGVRMAMLGCKLINLNNPTCHDQIKKLIVYVEMDRCAADAVAYVTGVKLGRRSLKFMDYGIMAASFVNLDSQKAIHVLSTEEARELATVYAPEVSGKYAQQTEAYKRMPDDVLFRVWDVQVRINEFDIPGPTRHKAICSRCGQVIRDHREIIESKKVLCKPCTDASYFYNAKEISLMGSETETELTGPSRFRL